MVMLTGLETFKTYAGITGTSEDGKITAIIEGVSDVIEKYCHRQFSYGSYDQKWDIWDFDEDTVQVDNWPIISVVALTDNGTAVSSDKYHIYKKEGIISLVEQTYISQHYRRDQYFTRGHRMVSATYFGGYQDIPNALQLATKMVVSRLYNNSGKEEMESESIGDYKYVKAKVDPDTFFLPQEKAFIDLFKAIT